MLHPIPENTMSTTLPTSQESQLTPEQIAFYQENGYLLVKGLFSREEAAQ